MTNKGWKLIPMEELDMQEVCVECGRKFNLLNVTDNEGWHFGHDCEES